MTIQDRYVCRHCGGRESHNFGRCGRCRKWNALERLPEEGATEHAAIPIPTPPPNAFTKARLLSPEAPKAQVISLFGRQHKEVVRVVTGIAAVDDALGDHFGHGGIARGRSYLLAGLPGKGKTSLSCQIANAFDRVTFVSAEDKNPDHLQEMLTRLELSDLAERVRFVGGDDWRSVYATLEDEEPECVVIDSIHMLKLRGTRDPKNDIMEHCKLFANARDATVIVIAHMNLSEQLRDGVGYEYRGDGTVLLQSVPGKEHWRKFKVTKNRAGRTDLVTYLERTKTGALVTRVARARPRGDNLDHGRKPPDSSG